MKSIGKAKLTGVLLFCGLWGLVLFVAFPVVYAVVISGAGLLQMLPVLIPLGLGFEYAISPLLTLSLLMIAGDG